MKIGTLFLLAIVSSSLASAAESPPRQSPACEGSEYQTLSQELKKIYEADQSDRSDFESKDSSEILHMLGRDRARRTRVAEIFAKGCLQSADDYVHAATVFQHGEVPDHFYQVYIWAMRAVQLGKNNAGQLAANGIDRFLAKSGRKQLYGGHAELEAWEGDPSERCFCLWPTESSFPESRRKSIGAKTKKELVAWLVEINQGREGCVNTYCKVEAKPSPRGSVPGVW
jgi:hypothetical protein